jgi:O-acetylhomoserine/O-acetylserine sulfhydrylase-like pyridoxal-dependent enzyme
MALKKYATSFLLKDSLCWVGDSAVYPRQTFYFYPQLCSSYFWGDSLPERVLAQRVFESNEFRYETEVDSLTTDSLVYMPVAMSRRWGKGEVILVSTPLIFTNYGMLDGHATSVGGVIVDSGNFDWDAHADKFPGLCTPDESYHGLTYTKAFGKMAYITKATAQLMRDLGSIQSPQNAFLLNLGLETLHLRMPQHCKNAQTVAEYLAQNDKVAWVNYCGLPGDKYYEQAQKFMPNGSCGVVTFGLKGGREESIKFMDSLKLAAIVTHVADARTCVLHPASHTHRQLTDEQLIEAGVAPDLIRLSVGIENANDIIADLEQAMNQI